MIRPIAYVASGIIVGVSAAALLLGPRGQAEGPVLRLPSGQEVTPYQVLWERHEELNETWMIIRMIAPRIARDGGDIDFDTAATDMAALCQAVGIPVLAATGGADQVLVNLTDRPTVRGDASPDATQFANAYQVQDGACTWTQ